MSKLSKILLASLFLFACSEDLEQKPTTPLIIHTSNGEIRFNVEVAQTPEELKTGLMYRTQMPLNNGMIFSMDPIRPTAMWMKNTKISLDMLFIAPDATISLIKENATPMSEEHIISRDPVRAVIELNAGQVKRHGIKIGDKVNHAILNNLTTLSDMPEPQAPIPTAAAGPIMPKGPNAVGPIIPKGPNAVGPIMPKGPNAAGPIMPKGPNAAGPIMPKGPNAAGPIMPKGPNAAGPIMPKGPNATGGQVIPKGPNAPQLPIPAPM